MDLQYYKQHVSIVQLVESLGYSYNRNKGRNPKQYEHPNGDKVIISDKMNPNMEVYFTRNDYEDNGTVVDFVKNRLSMFNVHYKSEWEGVLKVLSEFSGDTNHFKTISSQSTREREEQPKLFDQSVFDIKNAKVNDLSYLLIDRSLSKETLAKFLSYIKTVRKKDKPFTNIGFPYTIPNQEKFQGFELVNHSFKGHASGSQRRHAVWIADLSNTPQLVSNIYIAESAIDAMSFYQLYQGKYNFKNSVFISTGGSVLKNQVKNVINAYPKAKINTLFDNDFSGKMYDIFLAGIKANKEISIRKNEDSILIELKKGTFEIPIEQISLARFERVTGIRSGVRAFKAEEKDFNEMVQNRSTQNEQLTYKSRMKR